MRKLREFSTPAQTANTTFDQGKTRIIDVVYGPTGVYVKARGMKGWKFAAWTGIYDRAAAAEAGFDPSPRSGKVITRGRSSFQQPTIV